MIAVDYLRILSQQVPTIDKWAVPTAVVLATIVSNANTILTAVIGLLTIATMIPRALIAWREWRRDQDDDERA